MPVHSSEGIRSLVVHNLAHRLVVAALLVAALGAPASQASAQADSTVTTRVTVFTGAGFGGTGEITYEGAFLSLSGQFDLGSTPLAGIRYETVFLRYLAFGGQVRTSFWRTTGNHDRNPLIDLAMTPRLRYPIVIRSWFMVEPYIVVPVGVSLAIWNHANVPDPSTGLDRANPALSVGALGGVTLLSRSGVGGMVEFGWMHHVGYDRDDSDNRYRLKLNQATIHAGVVYAF